MNIVAGIFAFLGLGSIGVGIYNKIIFAANHMDDEFASMFIALGREMGAYKNYSIWDKLKMWCAENSTILIIIGIVLLILGFVIARSAKKRSYEKLMEKSMAAARSTWKCPKCNNVNIRSKATCGQCGAERPVNQ